MKKIFTFLITLLMVISMTACGGNNDTNTPDKKQSSENIESTDGNTTTEQKDDTVEKNDIELMYTFKDPGQPVAFDYPNLKSIEEGTSQVFKNSKYIIVYCRDEKKVELDAIVDTLTEKFKMATSTHLKGEFDSFAIDSSESTKLGDVDALIINGSVIQKYDDGSTIKLPIRGYVFSKGGIACEVIGSINEELNESNKANQEEMTKTIDAMMSTLRDDR